MKMLSYAVMLAFLSTPALAATKTYKKQAKPTQVEQAAVVDASVLRVSDSELTTFVLPRSVKNVLFPGRTSATGPIVAAPIYFADNTQVVMQFLPSKTPVQMVLAFADKSISNYRVLPTAMSGRVQPLNMGAGTSKWVAAGEKSDTLVATGGVPAINDDVEMLKQLVSTNNPPAGFEAVSLPKPVSYDLFTVVPIAAWSDSQSKRIMVFQLVANAGKTAVVSNTQFYREGLSAVMLDGDVVDANTSPMLYIVEDQGE